MTDLFAQQGINFMSASMASTHPTTTPAPIEAPKVDLDNAPANVSSAAPAAAPIAPAQNSDAQPQDNRDWLTQLTDPQQSSQSLAGAGSGGAAAAGVAPPQPQANTDIDLFQQQGIKGPTVSDINANAFSSGLNLATPPEAPDQQAAAKFVADNNAQVQALAQKRFTSSQLANFSNNPQSLSEAINNKQDWPDMPMLMKKLQAGDELNESQKSRVNEYVDTVLETNLRGMGWDGNTAVGTKMLPQVFQDYINSGASGQPAGDSVGTTNDVTVQKGIFPPAYTPKVGERPLNDYAAVTDKGQQIMAASQDKPASTAFKVASFEDLPIGVKAGLYNTLTAYKPTATLSEIMQNQAAYHNAVDTVGEDNAAKIVHWYSPLSFAEHQAAQYQGGVLPFSKDAQGKTRFDPRAGMFGFVTVPEDVRQGNIPPEDIEGASRDMAINMAMMEFGEKGGAILAGRKSGKAAVDTYLDGVTASKDKAMVDNGIVSIEGAKSTATAKVEKVLIDHGTEPVAAQEAAANLTAVEKDNFLAKNDKPVTSPVPTLEQNAPATILADNVNGQGADAAKNIIAGGTREANAANPPLIPDQNSGFNSAFKSAKVYAEMWNDLQPIENLGKLAKERGAPITESELSPAALSLAKSTPALIERQWTTGTTTWDIEGNQIVTGKGLKQIGDDFDNVMDKIEPNRDARQQDMRDFRKAMTFIEDKTRDYNPVSEKDFSESQATLSRLSDKYGDQMKWFETFAKEYRDFDNRILHNLVTSGLKTQAWYDDLVGKREWYSSTARVIETEYADDVAAINKNLGSTVNPNSIGALKQRKGSELEVQDPVISSMRNSAIIIRRATLNKVRLDTAKYAEYYPEKVKVKPPALIRAQVDHSYDPKLRTKLEQLVEFLGGKVNRVKQGDIVGDKKSNLGAYEPGNDIIHMRQGSTEGTLTHEAGHMLDYKLGLKERLLGDPEMKAELQKLSEDRLRSDIKLEQTPDGKTEFAERFERNPKKYVDYVKSDREVLANFFDAWVNSPEQAKAKAPKATAAFEKLIDENPQLAALRDLAPSTQRATEVIQKALLDFKGPKDSLPFYDNGKLMFLHMDEDTAAAFKGLDQVQSSITGNFIAKIGKAQAKVLQFGATNNPYFIVRHFLRGAQSSYVNTPEGGARGFFQHFAIEIPKGIAAVIGKNDAYREWASSSGALRTYMDTSAEGMAKLHEKMFEKGSLKDFIDPRNWASLAKNGLVNGWTTAKQVSDYAPRIAAYERLKDKGYSDLEAGFLSLEATGNYIRHGSLGKQINAYTPFFNDRLQGADRFLRAVKRDPAGYSMRAIALITMPQLLVTGYYLFGADDQTRKEYLNLSDFRRSTAMNIKINGQWIPFPRAFAPGFVFGALPEQAMIHFSQVAHPELKNFWLHMMADTISSLSPSTDWTQTIPPMLKSMIEATTNYSFFRNMPLFSGDKQTTAPENQYNSHTSESAKALGRLFGVSPVDIDNTIYDMSAHIGVYAQQLGDYGINTARRLQGQPVNEKPTKGSDNPLYGPLMQPAPVGTASESFQEFNEHAHDLAQQHNRDKEFTGKDKADFEQANHQDLALYPTIARANTEVRHVEHEIRLITENPQFTGDQKAQMIAQRQQKIQVIVEGANNVYRNAKGQNQ